MKLTFFRGSVPNFGDELNTFMWDQLLPVGFLDDDERDLFLGIGSIIWDDLPKDARKHVIGSGYGGYTDVPNMHDGMWNVVWVRGPLTAQKLGLDPACAITDAAVLLRAIDLPPAPAKTGPAFMPHFESVPRGNWKRACELAGITYLDPTSDAKQLIQQIKSTTVLITEAMHGAIVADALRTPFIPVTPTHFSHRDKWLDWAMSVDLTLRPVNSLQSSLIEVYVKHTGLSGKGQKSKMLFDNAITAPVNNAITHFAAKSLLKILKNNEPQQSSDHIIESVTDKSLHTLNQFLKQQKK